MRSARSLRAEDPICASEEFMMYCFKVAPCCKQYCHDWWACPFAHENEKARRRDPRTFNYAPVACPIVKQGKHCTRGDLCMGTHNVFEYWLHPSRFRTQFCGRGIHCSQPFCFFAHSMAELRHPSTDFAEMQQDGSSRTPSIISDTPPKDINNIAQLSRNVNSKMVIQNEPAALDMYSSPFYYQHRKHHRTRSASEFQTFVAPAMPNSARKGSRSTSQYWNFQPVFAEVGHAMPKHMHACSQGLGGVLSLETSGSDAYHTMAESAERLLRMMDDSGTSN